MTAPTCDECQSLGRLVPVTQLAHGSFLDPRTELDVCYDCLASASAWGGRWSVRRARRDTWRTST